MDTLEDVKTMEKLGDILEDLRESLNISNLEWNSWERKFIADVGFRAPESLSEAQVDKARELWNRI